MNLCASATKAIAWDKVYETCLSALACPKKEPLSRCSVANGRIRPCDRRAIGDVSQHLYLAPQMAKPGSDPECVEIGMRFEGFSLASIQIDGVVYCSRELLPATLYAAWSAADVAAIYSKGDFSAHVAAGSHMPAPTGLRQHTAF